MKFQRSAYFLFLFISSLLGIGCSESSREAIALSPEVRALENSIAKLELSRRSEEWEKLKKNYFALTNVTERKFLLNNLTVHLQRYDFSKLSIPQARDAYEMFRLISAWLQEEHYKLDKDIDNTLEMWFLEIETLKKELNRCRAEQKHFKDRTFPNYDSTERIEAILSEIQKACPDIDMEHFMAHIYCTQYPEKKKAFLKRVKKVLGRYPEWYKEDK